MIDPQEGLTPSQVWLIAGIFGLVSAIGNMLQRWGKFRTKEEAIGSFLGSIVAGGVGGCLAWVLLRPVHPGVIIIATATSSWVGEITLRATWERLLCRMLAAAPAEDDRD